MHTDNLIFKTNDLYRPDKDKSLSEDGTTKGTGKVSVVELLKMPKAMRDIFGAVRGEYGECLRPNEVTIAT